jgi:alpha-tubulin suppressor-like RCC1 family protein
VRADISDATDVVSGDRFWCVLHAAGSVTCFGSSEYSATSVPELGRVSAIAAANTHACALLADHTVSCWGDDMDADRDWMHETEGEGLEDSVAIATGERFACVLLTTGHVRCWGDDWNGQLGDGLARPSGDVADVEGIDDAVAITAGWSFACALHAGGQVSCWGSDIAGQLGDGLRVWTPVQVIAGA